MCDPLTIAGIALTGASVAANTVANNQVQAARDDALAAERIRQSTLDKEADAINAGSRERYDNFEGQQDQKSAQLGDYFANTEASQPAPAAALPVSQSQITVTEEQGQRAKAKSDTDASAAALGNLRAFGDLLGGIGRQQARDASRVGQIGGFKVGSSNILPYELEDANKAGSGLRLFGDILGGVGSLGLNAGLSGSSLFGLGGSTPTIGSSIPVPRSKGTSTVKLGSLFGGGI